MLRSIVNKHPQVLALWFYLNIDKHSKSIVLFGELDNSCLDALIHAFSYGVLFGTWRKSDNVYIAYHLALWEPNRMHERVSTHLEARSKHMNEFRYPLSRRDHTPELRSPQDSDREKRLSQRTIYRNVD